MANTYTQLIVQIVFAVYGKQNLIAEKHRERLEKYIVVRSRTRNQNLWRFIAILIIHIY
ncbi:hypothetical protein C8N47_1024 [Mangrovibacterium marinum]|uniref:Uncharacterized protein n=1 Tax=Mangrovibacterium marinum TaxID=1639118 RepID=A0A2T5C551_9BACT|nr:hypothetical protein C8N47_1024 [Mangrovibacterium marinum]